MKKYNFIQPVVLLSIILLSSELEIKQTPSYFQSVDVKGIDTDIFKHPLNIIRKIGLEPEVHEIVTEDKYILTAWRIKNNKVPRKKKPVLIQHGLMDLSFSWFIHRKRDRCLPTILADAGYDVWVLNSRGNRYSRKAQKEVNPKQYWEFSFQEMARYDVTANVKYVKKVTKSNQVHFIGHSQGTTQFFAKMIEEPSFQENIASFIALAPVFFITEQQSKLLQSLINLNVAEILDKYHLHNFLSPPGEFNPLQGVACLAALTKGGQLVALEVGKQVAGPYTGRNWDPSIIPIVCSHEPGGTSMRNLEHWTQVNNKKGFYYFDYGDKVENFKHYNQPTAPSYPLENFKKWKIPTYFIRGKVDYLTTEADLNHLLSLMPDNYEQIIKQTIIPEYSHIEVLWANDTYNTVFLPALEFLELH